MKKTLTLLAFALFSSLALADSRLHGTWASIDAENGALPGTIVFKADGGLIIHPEGFEAAHGNWKSHKGNKAMTLTLDGIGSSEVSYALVASVKKQGQAKKTGAERVLELTYDNGNKQRLALQRNTSK